MGKVDCLRNRDACPFCCPEATFLVNQTLEKSLRPVRSSSDAPEKSSMFWALGIVQ